MPTVCEEIWRRIGLSGAPTDAVFSESATWGQYASAATITKGDPLFPRMKSDE